MPELEVPYRYAYDVYAVKCCINDSIEARGDTRYIDLARLARECQRRYDKVLGPVLVGSEEKQFTTSDGETVDARISLYGLLVENRNARVLWSLLVLELPENVRILLDDAPVRIRFNREGREVVVLQETAAAMQKHGLW